MASSLRQAARGRVTEAESRAYELTVRRNRIVNSEEWTRACAGQFFGPCEAYDRLSKQITELDAMIDRAEADRATWLALVNS